MNTRPSTPSPANLRGLSTRELGDHTPALAVLMETPNPVQGRGVAIEGVPEVASLRRDGLGAYLQAPR